MRKRYWRCPFCGMTERKEPHRTLVDHTYAVHRLEWSERDQCWYPEKKPEQEARMTDGAPNHTH